MKTLALILAGIALCGPVFAETNVLFDFESGDVSNWTLWSWPPDNSRHASTVAPHGGSYALGFGQWAEAQWGGVSNDSPPVTDWSDYENICYWVRAGKVHTGDWVKLRLMESSGERWSQMNETFITNVYQRVDRQLLSNYQSTNGFWLADGGGINWQLDLTNIVAVEFIFRRPVEGDTTATNYFIDDIQLWSPPAFAQLSVTPGAAGLGTIEPSPSNRRFATTNAVAVNYAVSGYDSWSIELYSTNNGGVAGLVGVDLTQYVLPLRCWWGEAGATPPDPEIDMIWTSFWAYVTDESDTWHPTLTDHAGPLGSGFEVHFATDPSGAYTQAYAAPVVIELVVE